MANLKISQLPTGTPQATDVIPFVDLNNNVTKKTLVSNLVGAGQLPVYTAPNNSDISLETVTNDSGNTGNINLTTGDATTGNNNGTIQLESGYAEDTGGAAFLAVYGDGSGVEIYGGDVVNDNDGMVSISGGAPISGSSGISSGGIRMEGGTPPSSTGGGGGNLDFSGGAGDGTGAGGDVIIEAGQGGSSNGSGGNAELTSGAGHGTNDAGNVILTAALSTGGVGLDGSIILAQSRVPANASDTGIVGAIAWDSGFIYICVTTNTWKRVAIATWP